MPVYVYTHVYIYIYVYTHMWWLFLFLLAFVKILGITSSSFLCPLFRRFLGRCCGAQGLLAGLLAAVPRRTHSATCRAAKWLLRCWVLEAAVPAGGVLTSLACSGNVFIRFSAKHLVLFHVMTKIALPRALGLAFWCLTEPSAPLTREFGVFIIP